MPIQPPQRSTLTGLENIPLFRRLSGRQLAALSHIVALRRYKKGDIIFRQGTPSIGCYVVRFGEVNVHRIGPDGSERVIRIFHPGESFAEASLVPGANYPVHARAEADCSLYLIARDPLLAVLERDPEIALRMIASLSGRLHDLVASIESLRGENTRTRLLRWLLSHSPATDNTSVYTIQLKISKSALAGELGMRQETLSRHLAELRKSDSLTVKGREIMVLNPGAMRDQLAQLDP